MGDGGIHFNFIYSDKAPDLEEKFRTWVIEKCVVDFDGCFSGEHGIGRSNQAYYSKYVSRKVAELNRAFKNEISPGKLGAPKFDVVEE